MAFCSNCGRAIADSADVCPNCGHPNEAKQAAAAQATMQAPLVATQPFAGWWRRVGARFIDGIIIGIIVRILDPNYSNGLSALGFVYEWLMLGLNDGRTLGKMALGIRIAHPDGSKISLGTALLRTAMSIVSFIAIFLGVLWPLWDSENRTWHDMVANTRAFKVSGRS